LAIQSGIRRLGQNRRTRVQKMDEQIQTNDSPPPGIGAKWKSPASRTRRKNRCAQAEIVVRKFLTGRQWLRTSERPRPFMGQKKSQQELSSNNRAVKTDLFLLNEGGGRLSRAFLP
jgi:hypothetical protein